VVLPQEQAAVEQLLPVVYEQLRRLAERYIRTRPTDTMHPTDLVHEAWMKLEPSAAAGGFTGREHYAAVASRAMRQILIDRARARGRDKRGGAPERTTLTGLAAPDAGVDVLDLHRALEELEAADPRGARVVELRYFGGLSAEEIGRWLDLSPRTVQTSWRLSRAFLVDRLRGGPGEPTSEE
jgi:RNA polymerase sigma-70 factor (ECF subfamily)